MSTASIEALGALHAKVAEVLTSALQGDEPDPKILAAAISFLKNNQITAEKSDLTELTALAEELARKRALTAQSQRGLAQAAADFGSRLQ